MSNVVPLLKFTPSAQDPQVLETITVQRESLVVRLVEVALEPEGARHQLLIGPRGIGKTHLLSLVANRVRETDPELVTIAWMEEDPWGVGSYEKFLAAILAAIAEERSDPELEARAAELHATRDESGRLGEEALREAVGVSRLVLLVENLDDIFRRIGENGQERFRAFIEDWQRMLVVATAPQLFEGVQVHESPFYGFFAITHLEELSLDSATELMRLIAELRGDRELVSFLRSEVARRRLAAVEALAGGHPRIWLLLSGCVSIDAIDELVPLFLEALDDLTPYYQDRLRELGVQQQELVVQLSEAGGALSNRALAERSGIAQNQVATILGQLADRGYVRRAEIPQELASGDARLSYWELREPLMRLCLDVKQARGKPLRMVVEFLRAWYGPRLLDELAALSPSARLANVYVSEAFRTLPGVIPGQDLMRGSPQEILARVEAGLSADPERQELQIARATALMMEERYVEARRAYEVLIPKVETPELRFPLELQLMAAKNALGEDVDDDQIVEAMLETARAQPDAVKVQEVAGMALSFVDRHEDALEVSKRALRLGSESPGLLAAYARSSAELGHLEDALEVLPRAIELDPDDAEIRIIHGLILQRKGDFEEAVEEFEVGIELQSGRAEYYRYKADALNDLGRYEGALEAVALGLELDPEGARLHGTKGASLFGLARYDEALVSFTEASGLDPENGPLMSVRGVLLRLLGRSGEALPVLRRATELEPDNASIWHLQAEILIELDELEEAERVARKAVELVPSNSIFQFVLGEIAFARGDFPFALRQLRAALALWNKTRERSAGSSLALCAQLWDHWESVSSQIEVLGRIVDAYDEVDAAEDLGRGLVESAGWLARPEVPADKADAWVKAWTGAADAEDLQIPLRILQAAVAWKKDQDRAHLLALPSEQRKILVGLLAPEDDKAGGT